MLIMADNMGEMISVSSLFKIFTGHCGRVLSVEKMCLGESQISQILHLGIVNYQGWKRHRGAGNHLANRNKGQIKWMKFY